MQNATRPLGLFHLPCSLDVDPPTAEAIEANRRLRLGAFALHALGALGALAAGAWLLGLGLPAVASILLISCMASVALSLALSAYCLAQAGAPLPPSLLAPLAALCDEHPELDAYRRRVVAQGRFFCKEEFPMLASAASELALRPAFMRLYLVGAEAFGEPGEPTSSTPIHGSARASPPPTPEVLGPRGRVPRSIALPGESLDVPLDFDLSAHAASESARP